MNLSNQPVAIVTGAGSGIGRAASLGLAAKGYRVVLVGRRREALAQTAQRLGQDRKDWLAITGDITQSTDCSAIITQTIECFGQIDAIVNNAGLGTCHPLAELSESQIMDLFLVNAIGPINFVRLALPELIRVSGCVVNIASVAIVDPFIGLGVYGCTKAAVDGLTRTIHNEYGKQGVRAYTIAPGAVETEMLRSIVSKEMLPTANTLSAETVAGKIIACITGEVNDPSGSTIVVNSP